MLSLLYDGKCSTGFVMDSEVKKIILEEIISIF